jgi:hypothetical protein
MSYSGVDDHQLSVLPQPQLGDETVPFQNMGGFWRKKFGKVHLWLLFLTRWRRQIVGGGIH